MAPLPPDRLAELEAAFNATDDAETRLRYQMVLLAQGGKTPREIAPLVLRSHETVLRVLHRYEAGGLAAVATGVAVSLETVRRHLHAAGYVCKRPTWTLKRKAEEKAEYPGNAPGWRRS